MKKNLLTIVISAVLALIFVLLLFVFQVRQSEVAVVTPDRVARAERLLLHGDRTWTLRSAADAPQRARRAAQSERPGDEIADERDGDDDRPRRGSADRKTPLIGVPGQGRT